MIIKTKYNSTINKFVSSLYSNYFMLFLDCYLFREYGNSPNESEEKLKKEYKMFSSLVKEIGVGVKKWDDK